MTLAIHSGALGDVVLLGHLLKAIGGEVTLVAGGSKGRLLKGLGVAARAIDFDAVPMHEANSDTPLELCALRRLWGAHERLVSCFGTGHLRTELRLAALAGAQQAAFLPARPPAGTTCHLVELWCDMLGLDWPLEPQAWPVPQDWQRQAQLLLPQAHAPIALLHTGAGAVTKCWPAERFDLLADSLRREGFEPVQLVGPVELERGHASLAHAVAVAPPSLEILAGLLAQCAVFAGNDSGPAHLAAAVGAPTVALFGATSAVHFAPLGARVRVVAGATMRAIEPGEVLASIIAASRGRS
jgi:hypothetical protein